MAEVWHRKRQKEQTNVCLQHMLVQVRWATFPLVLGIATDLTIQTLIPQQYETDIFNITDISGTI